MIGDVVRADMNAKWNAGDKTDEMIEVIAKDAGMEVDAAKDTIATFEFPSVDEQLGPKWLGGGAQQFMKGVAKVFKDAGSIPEALGTYDDAVDSSYLKAASTM